MNVRYPAVAGMFYPANKPELERMIQGYLAQAEPPLGGRLRAVIAPHAGYVYSGPVAGKAFGALASLDQARSWRVILLGPSHHLHFDGASVATDVAWLTPLGRAALDPEVRAMVSAPLVDHRPAHLREHSLEVEVPFLQTMLERFALLPIITGEIRFEDLADALEPQLRDNTLLVVSSDLSHYHPYAEARKIDALANETIPALDVERFAAKAEACGKTAILTLLHLARRHGWQGHLLDYQTSGDTAGDHSQVVGYGAYAFTSS